MSLSKVSIKTAMKQYFFVSVLLKSTSQGRLLNKALCDIYIEKKSYFFISCRWEAFSNTRVQKVPACNKLFCLEISVCDEVVNLNSDDLHEEFCYFQLHSQDFTKASASVSGRL